MNIKTHNTDITVEGILAEFNRRGEIRLKENDREIAKILTRDDSDKYNEYVNRILGDNANPNILFICEGNAQRSPTLELWFIKNRPQYNVRSTGTAFAYNYPLNEELLEWCDIAFCCDVEQARFIHRRFNEFYHKVEIIGISDQYARESPQLYRVIEFWVEQRGL